MDATAKRTLKILLVILVVAAILTALYVYLANRQSERVAVEEKRAELEVRFGTLAGLEGESVAFDPLDEQVKVVMHWASWCAACIDELRSLAAVAESLDSSVVGIYAFNRGDPADTANAFLDAYNLRELSGITYILDQDDAHFGEVGGYAMPETIVYDGEGNVVEHVRGSIDQAALIDVVEAVNN